MILNKSLRALLMINRRHCKPVVNWLFYKKKRSKSVWPVDVIVFDPYIRWFHSAWFKLENILYHKQIPISTHPHLMMLFSKRKHAEFRKHVISEVGCHMPQPMLLCYFLMQNLMHNIENILYKKLMLFSNRKHAKCRKHIIQEVGF